jgi:hypothetical protein
VAPDLKEGIHFSIMFYGGRLLRHLSAEDSEVNDLIALLPINRYPAIIIDSDIGGAAQGLNATKRRVVSELESVGGFAWVTEGREIENYVATEIRLRAVQTAHPRAHSLVGARNRWGKPLDYQTSDGSHIADGFDKVRIARAVTDEAADLTVLDLRQRITGLAEFIRQANSAA